MAKKADHQVRTSDSVEQLGAPDTGLPAGGLPVGGRRRTAGRLAGWAGMTGFAVCQPTVLLYLGAVVLVLVVGVVLPAVWSRKPTRRQAAATVLRLLLTWAGGPWFADAVSAPATDGPHVPATSRKWPE
ncbi:MAG: hypothetical protein WCC65_04950 [Pseudonocardiaceae bacterium]